MDRQSLFANARNDLKAACFEYIGTTFFLLIGLGGIQAAAASNFFSLIAASNGGKDGSGAQAINAVASIDQLMYISTSMGLALLVSVWLFYRVTGGVFNPNVSLALLLVGVIGPLRFILYCVAQILGGITAAALLLALLPGPLVVVPTPGPRVNVAQATFIEMFLTAALVIAIFLLAVEKHRSTAIAPIGIGLTLFACHLFGVIYTGAAMNSARAFGPAVVTRFDKSHWVYWVGPTAGSLLGTTVYLLLKRADYYTLNPGQESDHVEDSPGIFMHLNKRDSTEKRHLTSSGAV